MTFKEVTNLLLQMIFNLKDNLQFFEIINKVVTKFLKTDTSIITICLNDSYMHNLATSQELY